MWPKIDLLEKALKNLLEKHIADPKSTETPALQKDFVEAFRSGLMLHFAVEKEALFPELQTLGKDASTTVKELLTDHDAIIKNLSDLETKDISQDKAQRWSEILDVLSVHGRKEETTLPPLVKRLNTQQLTKIDNTAKKLGYNL